ncbi:chemotaxis protein CheC [Aquibacillus koreensis]|uniref:Chemotaxis protein CheC n=1 Tax=Aquibacillus koreensis TaxID=279446 RepID=A0A9X3WQN2_9BACI|nr:chemotaxis protein CheC [Aquibacillus koreensis]MCT2534545.1 chemotaxis protein CheC [Aquibacillus koreensis]MDC3421861.1 chemotaxis protein CheC [Aquibacillus koreensis]
MSFFESLSNYQLDILKEIGNIGSGNAATALSKLLNRKVDMKVPAVRVVDFDEMMNMVGGPEVTIVSVFLRIQGEAPGSMFFVLTPEEAETFVHQVTGSEQFSLQTPPFEEIGLSALHEVGNILAGSYLSALSDFTSINMQPSVPSLHMDMAGAILMQGLVEISQESDYAIIIDTTINEQDNKNETIQGHFLLLPDPDSFKRIFAALGVKDL